MGVNQQVWAAEIKEKLFPNNSIVNESTNDDQYATAEKVIIPIAGSTPQVLKNNTNYPLAPVKRTDSTLEYNIDKLETKPNVMVGLEELSLSYDKRQSIMSNHVKALNTKSATYCIHKWSPLGSITDRVIRTTGGDRDAIVKSATGKRKLIVLDNIITAAEILDSLDVDEDGRVAFLPAKMKNDLMRISDIRKKETFGIETLPNGMVTKIMGFKIMYRSEAAVYNNAASVAPIDLLVGSPTLTDANAAGLFYHPDFVRKGFYNVQANVGQPQPEYSGGQSFNAIMKMGASPAYLDYLGVVALVEDHA